MHATWLQKVLSNATWDPFGTKTRPDGSKTLFLVRGTPTFGSLFAKKLRFEDAKRVQLRSKWLPKRVFEARLALGSSENEVLGVVFENIRNSIKFLCENA